MTNCTRKRVARIRSRPVETAGLEQRISERTSTSPQLARSQSAQGFGPVTKTSDLRRNLRESHRGGRGGRVVVVDTFALSPLFGSYHLPPCCVELRKSKE